MQITQRKREPSPDFLDFAWPIPECGYVWEERAQPAVKISGKERQAGPFLVVRDGHTKQRATFPLTPAKGHRPLFRLFAELREDPTEILEFANQHGWLGVGQELRLDGLVTTFRRGESLWMWLSEILALRKAVSVWDCLRTDNRAALKEYLVHDESRKAILFHWEGGTSVVADSGSHHPALYGVISGNLKWAARGYLLLKLNHRLRNGVSPQIILGRNRHFLRHLGPQNLPSAFWLQLYQEVIGDRRIQDCKYCGQAMDVTGYRRSKVAHQSCVNLAKVREYRRKQHSVAQRERPK